MRAAHALVVAAAGVDRSGLDGVAGIDVERGRDRAGKVAVEDGRLENAGLRSGGDIFDAASPSTKLVATLFDGAGRSAALRRAHRICRTPFRRERNAVEVQVIAFEGSLELQFVQRAGDFGALGFQFHAAAGGFFPESDEPQIPPAGDIGGRGQQGQTEKDCRSEHVGIYDRRRENGSLTARRTFGTRRLPRSRLQSPVAPFSRCAPSPGRG